MKTNKLKYILSRFFIFGIIIICSNQISAQDLNPALWPHMKGYWKFQQSNNLTKATVGNNLSLVGSHQLVAGPAYGDTAIRIGIGSYYRCSHNIAPNGGGDSVNRYTLMFDFKVKSLLRWHTFHQTDTTNTNDGECFIKPISNRPAGAIGVGYTSYSADTIVPNKWYRLVITVNLGHYYDYYLNGSLIHKGDTDEIFIDKRFALTPKILFFADNNQEDDTIDIASVAIFDTCLSAADIGRLGSIDPCVANPPSVNLGHDTSLCDYNNLIKSAGSGFNKYLWSTGDTISSVTLTKSKLGTGQNFVWAKVTDINGCMASDTFSVTYMASPVVNLGANRGVCSGKSTVLDAGNDTTNQYLWKYMPTGVTLSTLNSITVDSAGKYVVLVTSPFGCVITDTIEIVVNQNPQKPTITVIGATSFCDGGSVELKAPTGYLQCQWQDGAGNLNRIITLSGWYKVNVTDYHLCTSVYSDSVAVTVYPKPNKPAISITGKREFCDGDSVIFTVPSGYAEYWWQDGPGTNQRIVKQSGFYKVFVIDSNNCSSPFSDSISVIVNKNPSKPSITITGSPTVCMGDSIQLTATSGFAGYFWSTGDTTEIIYIKNSKKVTLIVFDSNDCFSPVSDSADLRVNPNPPRPLIQFIGDSVVCEGETISLSGPSGYTAYLWSTLGTTQIIQVSTTQQISLIVLNSFGCKSPASDSVLAKVNARPPKPTISERNDSLICSVKGTYYKWYVTSLTSQEKIIFPQNTQIITDLWSPKYYYVVVVDSNGCLSDTSDRFLFDFGSVKERYFQLLEIYPNPASIMVFVRLNNLSGTGDVSIRITDINGKNVNEIKTTKSEIMLGIPVNIENLKQGIYFMQMITSDRIYTARIHKL